MSNMRATVLDIAIPLKSKTANNNEHDYNLLLGVKSIAISLKAQAIMLACLNGLNRRNIASLHQFSRDISVLT